MTIADLIARLQSLPPDLKIACSTRGEYDYAETVRIRLGNLAQTKRGESVLMEHDKVPRVVEIRFY